MADEARNLKQYKELPENSKCGAGSQQSLYTSLKHAVNAAHVV